MNALLWKICIYIFLFKWGILSPRGNLSFFWPKRSLKARQTGGREEGTSIWKWRGRSSEILQRTPKRYQSSVLWVCPEQFFTPKRYQTGWLTFASCHIFQLITLKSITMPLTEVYLDFSTLRGTKPQILTPKRYGDHPFEFYRRAPLPLSPFPGDFRRLKFPQ